MPSKLPASPSFAQHRITTTLGGTPYILRYTWVARLESWYVDLLDEAGAELIAGRRISPGFAPWVAVELDGLPTGVTIIRGEDGYARLDLGGSVALTRFAPAELPVASTFGDLGITQAGP